VPSTGFLIHKEDGLGGHRAATGSLVARFRR
jgi:hypothetical protein